MLKSLLDEKGLSIYKLSKESKIPYSTLNDLVNHKLPIENMRCGQVHGLALALSMDMDTLYEMCAFTPRVVSNRYGVQAGIRVKHKHFWVTFQRDGKSYEGDILAVCKDAFKYLDTLAEWKLNEILAKLEMEDAYAAIHSKTV